MNDESVAAIEDFELALLSEGPGQACNTLLSYSVELTGANAEVYDKILQIYCNYLERSEACGNAGAWSNRFEAKTFLTCFLEAHPILVAQLQRSWQQSLGYVILNLQNASMEDHLARIKALQIFLPEALAGAAASLHEGRCPCNDHSLRSLIQTALFSLAQDPQLDHDLERLLEMSFAFYAYGATTPLALASLMQISFEAALNTVQAPATVQSIDRLDIALSKVYWKKAWTLISTLQQISSTACDIFWGAYASTVRQLATLVIRHERDHLGLSCALKLVCNPDSAHMLLQSLLAIPTATSTTTGGAAGAGGGAGNLKSIKSAFKTSLVLLREFPEAFVSACCDILTPAMNAALATRIEALHAIKLAIDHHSSNEEHVWTQDAIEKLLFALCRDPSVRLRRKAIELLQHVLQKRHSSENAVTEEAAVLSAITERCTDQDADVRRVAYTCLNKSVQFTKLVGVLDSAQWRRIFEEGLAEEGAATTRQAREIFSAAKRLFEKYLRQDEENSRLDQGAEDGDVEISNVVAESKAVLRLNELFSGTIPVSRELMATLAEILTERDLTCAID
ncbi:hypothetical protein Ndes2526B_g01056 [Nannochloris sp. 'desiccata']|nr:hypothetical protein NADE_008628 [Chlorella desiccata (nom. nud.)]